MKDGRNSYRQILLSSSIVGGAQGVNYLVSLIRVKVVAALLGPAGVGLVGLYMSAIELIGTVSGLGLGSSGVREVAQAYNQQDQIAIARTAFILRRACWATGFLGWGLAAVLAAPLSTWVSGSAGHAAAIGLLGVTLLLGAVNHGQTALLQGMRRIGDIARASVVTMLINTGVAIGLYSWLGKQGIILVLIVTSAVSLSVSWWFVRRIHVECILLSWAEAVTDVYRLAGLGMAFMWSGLLIAGLDFVTRSLIIRLHGIDAAGVYQAAWTISGLFANFILSAMGTDFFPRLTGVIHDHQIASQTVNEQIEIGMLLALPGLLGTLAFAPWLMEMFYSKQFLAGAMLLPWFVLGILGRVISWPLGFIMLAKGTSRWFAITETALVGFQLGLLMLLMPHWGLVSTAYAFAITYFVYTLLMLFIAQRLIGFRLSASAKKLLAQATGFVLTGLALKFAMPDGLGTVISGSVTLVGTFLSLRGLTERLGDNYPLVKMMCRLPGGHWLLKGK